MNRSRILFLAPLVVLLAALGIRAQSPNSSDLVVHEWGTFLAMNGSDGVALDGMYHEEHALPGFVHARSRDQLRLRSVSLKGETPVIYFYTGQRRQVRVNVRFPQGIWTQWYPQACLVSPQLAQLGSPMAVRDGRIQWHVEVIPPGDAAPAVPTAASDALWNYSRSVDAAYVRTLPSALAPAAHAPEYERFLFYRGLGRATLPLSVTAARGGTLALDRKSRHGVRHLFVVRVEKGRGVYRYLPELRPGQTLTEALPALSGAEPKAAFTRRIAEDLAARLVESGLYPREARAMVDTWRSSYFESDGIRVLFVLPQAWTDAFIPLTVTPKPKSVVRVMVGRTELLTPARERKAEDAVRDLAAPAAARRTAAFAYLRDQGRYVEPILRRVERTTRNARVRTLCRRLLLTDFVTELRTATRSAATGARLQEDPVPVRAQLAGLLRAVGQDAEARAEASAALAALRARPEPPFTNHEARHYLRAQARAQEGLGDERGAAAAYEKFVRFGAQTRTCGGCHLIDGPRDMAWFRDWWAGGRYAEYVARTGQTTRAIAANEARLQRDPNDTAAQMLLAYLYGHAGKRDRAERMWARIAPSDGGRRAAGQESARNRGNTRATKGG